MLLIIDLNIPSVTAQEDSVVNREYEIKAAYLYNFAKYVEWPSDYHPAVDANQEQVFVIGVVGSDPFGEALGVIAREKRVGDKRIVVRQIRDKDDDSSCHILYFPSATKRELTEAVLAKTRSTPTLMVGETEGFLQSGGVVNFFVEENKVKFEIDPDAASMSKLKISSKLLNIARTSQAKQ